jgi:transposase-like protein
LAVGKIGADLNGEALGSSSPVAAASIGVAGFRFPIEVIVVAVRWYPRYGLPYRDVEELLAERGVEVDHVTVLRWVQRFYPAAGRRCTIVSPFARNRWFVDETYVKVNRVWRYGYRAVDQHRQVIDAPVLGSS